MIRPALLAVALRATACLGVDGSAQPAAAPAADVRDTLDAGTASADQATADVAAARDLVPWGNCVWDAGAIHCAWAAGDGGDQ
jgi:hypothetical protein